MRPHATDADVERLREAAEACRAAASRSDVVDQLAANRRFHDALHGLAGSATLVRLIDQLWDTTEAYRALYYALPGEAAEADAAHAALVEAVAARDGDRAVLLQDAHRERALDALRIAFSRQASAA
jgi:DNA-binding GntR family transcriptional regulator